MSVVECNEYTQQTEPPEKDHPMRLYFNGLLPLIDLGDEQPACVKCNRTPFNLVNHVFEYGVKYDDGNIYWSCGLCKAANTYKMTNDDVEFISRANQNGQEYTKGAVIARIQTSNDNIDYHSWTVRLYKPILDNEKERGYSALSYRYKGYVNDSPYNDCEFHVVDGHNQKTHHDLKHALCLLLNSDLGYYEEPCDGCGTILEVSPSWKHSYDKLSESLYCCQCHSIMIE